MARNSRLYEFTKRSLTQQISNATNKLSTLYENRVSGAIDTAFLKKKHNETVTEQHRLQGELDKLRKADVHYMENGVILIELAQAAHSLYIKKSPMEQRIFLDAVLYNITLKDAKLSYT